MIDDNISAATLQGMRDVGVRGVRFNLVSGNGTPVDQLQTMARRLAPLGWHIQVYAEGETMLELGDTFAQLPVPIVIDHCGGVKAGLGTAHPQFQALLRLLDSGNAWVKTCSYRVSSTGMLPFARRRSERESAGSPRHRSAASGAPIRRIRDGSGARRRHAV